MTDEMERDILALAQFPNPPPGQPTIAPPPPNSSISRPHGHHDVNSENSYETAADNSHDQNMAAFGEYALKQGWKEGQDYLAAFEERKRVSFWRRHK